MFMLSCTTRDLGFRSVNNASIFDNTELKAFKNIKFLYLTIDPKIYLEQMHAGLLTTLQ